MSDNEGGGDEEEEKDGSSSLIQVVGIKPLFEESAEPAADDRTAELLTFRETWKAELRAKRREQTPSAVERDANEKAAKVLFLEGVEFEKSGQMSEAVSRYQKACKLVPDIERRVYRSDVDKRQNRQRSRSRAATIEADSETKPLPVVMREKAMSALANERTPDSIYCLPLEIISHVMRSLAEEREGRDARFIDSLALVSSVFYVAARNEEMWRRICANVWGAEGAQALFDDTEDATWRDIYIYGPRPHVHGLYVAKTTYIRHGESSFQDSNYRPWHTVVYYRLLRFFADGTVLQCVTTEHPQSMVDALRDPDPPKGSNILKGAYTMDAEDGIRIKVVRQEFRARLRFDSSRGSNWNRHLLWMSNVCEVEYATGEMMHTELFTPADAYQNYPSLRFTRVKSYACTLETLETSDE